MDVLAPAAQIDSAFLPLDPGPFDPDEVVCQLSGISMAAPHVSGVAAMILSEILKDGFEAGDSRIWSVPL